MYLSKNSRCVLRNSQWFSSNFLERNFKLSLNKSRARWPEDDPTKPPLRLNIPRDNPVASPYSFNTEVIGSKRYDRNERLTNTQSWVESTLSQDVRSECGGSDDWTVSDDELRRTQSSHALVEGQNSADTLDSQNYAVKSNSSESADPQRNPQETGLQSNKTEKNFKLKKIRNKAGVKIDGDNVSNALQAEERDGILTIHINLNDEADEERKAGVSEMETKEEVTSDEKIEALAEAIVRELSPAQHGDPVEPQMEKSENPQEDEAFLVIINVTDKDRPEESSTADVPMHAMMEESPEKQAEYPNASNEETNSSYALAEDDRIQVRDLEFSDEVEKVLFRRKSPRAKSWSRRGDDVKSEKHIASRLDLGMMSESTKGFGRNNDRELKELQQLIRLYKQDRLKKGMQCVKESSRESKDWRKDSFERSIQRVQMSRTWGKKSHSSTDITKLKFDPKYTTTLSETRGEVKRRANVNEWRSPGSIVYAPERELRMRTKIVPENYLEKKIESLGEETKQEEPPTIIPALILKPLSKQVTLIDEIPELLNYPEFKYAPLRKTGECRALDKSCGARTIRSYHRSCELNRKLTSDVSDAEKTPLAVMAGMGKKENSGRVALTSSSIGNKEDLSVILNADRVLLSQKFRNNLDVSCKMTDLKGPNDVYLQGGNAIGDIAPKEVTMTDGAKDSNSDRIMQCSETEGTPPAGSPCPPQASEPSPVGITDERSELDIADITSLSKVKSKVTGKSASTAVFPQSDANSKAANAKEKIPIVRGLADEKFEMNQDCVTTKSDVQEKDPAGGSGTQPPAPETRKDVIINVMKAITEMTPKMSDNIVNLANEDLAQNKGVASLDSLSMMKRVKEIVDLDLKNAEKIFVQNMKETTGSETDVKKNSDNEPLKCDVPEVKPKGSPASESNQPAASEQTDLEGRTTVTTPENPPDFDPRELVNFQSAELTEQTSCQLPATAPDAQKVNEDTYYCSPNLLLDQQPLTHEDLNEPSFIPPQLKSVVIYNEVTKKFYVDPIELQRAEGARRENFDSLAVYDRDSFDMDEDLLRMIGIDGEELKNLAVYLPENLDVANVKYILKTGDSIIVYDEDTKSWKVDYSLLRERERQQQEQSGEQFETPPTLEYDISAETPAKETQPLEDPFQSCTVRPSSIPKLGNNNPVKSQVNAIKEREETRKKEISKRKNRNEPVKELDAEEIRRKNSDLYEDVFIEVKKQGSKPKEGDATKGQEGAKGDGKEPPKLPKKADGSEKPHSDHYVSKNIVEMSKSSSTEKGTKIRSNKIETIKVNISPTKRPPSKVTEINLNKKSEEGKGSQRKEETPSGKGSPEQKKPDSSNGTFYEKFEKYNTPFSDPEYEEKPMKINSDLESNPNLKKLDSWNKTLVLQEISKTSDNIEGWLKDETDKMATLLLKVLQEAAEGNTRRRIAAKAPFKGNPYEAIRKKQENGLMRMKKKEFVKKRVFPVHVRTLPIGSGLRKTSGKGTKQGQFPQVEDESRVEIIKPDSIVPKDGGQNGRLPVARVNEAGEEEIPGPDFIRKLASFWKLVPEISCQATIFVMIRMFQIAKMGLSFLSLETKKVRDDPFEKLFNKYGPVVKLHGPLSGDVVLVNRVEDIANVFAQAQTSPSRSVLDSVESCRNRVRQKNFPIGITDSCNGIEWDVVRKSTIDVGNKGCLQYFNMLKHADNLLVNRIKERKNHQNVVPDDFIHDIKKWSMEGLCCVLFDKCLGFLEKKEPQVHWISESERLIRHLTEATDCLCQCESHFQLWRFLNTPAINGLNQAYQSLDLIISKYIYQAEISLRKKRKTLITNQSDVNKNLNFLESMLLNDRMTPDEISSNLIDTMLIGANATTIALGFLLYNLAQNSRVQRQLFKEVKDLLPKKDSQLNYHQLHSLKYLQACLKESLRLNIPVPLVLRVLPNDIAVANYHVPIGTHMVMDPHTACMKDQSFEEPERFKPERWLEQDCIHPFTSIPFCNGPRAGFVKRLAEIQLWTCIAKIVRNYQIEYNYGEIKGTGKVISYPDKPLKLTFVEREE